MPTGNLDAVLFCTVPMINLSLYSIFLIASVSTIMSPGPGVLMVVTNAVRLGFWRTIPGIFGCAAGTLVVAGISVTGLGVVIATSETLYSIVKCCGILFLLYLGWKKFRAKPFVFKVLDHHIQHETENRTAGSPGREDRPARLFGEGILLQLSNPALIIFYLSLFPQCIDSGLAYWPQVIFLAVNYSLILLIVHSGYALIIASAAERFLNDSASVWINRISGAAYWLLALGFGIPMLLGKI